MEPRELAVMRRQTEQFIKENPTSLTVNRNVRTPNGKGGYTMTPTPQAPQTFRIIPQVRAGAASQNIDGEKVDPVFVLIGRWDANIGDNDTFSLGGKEYAVQHVRGAGLSTAYETWAEVIYRG